MCQTVIFLSVVPVTLETLKAGPGMVVQIHNPRYATGKGRRITV
jgi:hypothetical protein